MQKRQSNMEYERRDLLQNLMREVQKPKSPIAMDTSGIIDHMSELLLTGSESTANATAFLFLELARNPDVRAKLMATLPILSTDSDILTSKTIRNDPDFWYLEACIKETLRLNNTVAEMGRYTGDQAIEVLGYQIPPRTTISVSLLSLHRDEKYFPQPLRFWPERFLPADQRGDAPEAKYE